MLITWEEKEQIEIRLDFWKVERLYFGPSLVHFSHMSTLNPQKLGRNPGPKWDQKHVFQSFSDSAHQIFLISCMRLEVNSEHVSAKTARPKKIRFLR